MGLIISEANIAGVIIVIGAFLWNTKPIWAKALGVLVFASALGMTLGSPALLASIAVIALALSGVKILMLRRKNRKDDAKRHERVEALRRAGYMPSQRRR